MCYNVGLLCSALPWHAQVLNMRHYSAALGLDKPKRIVAAGGAAANKHILQARIAFFRFQARSGRKAACSFHSFLAPPSSPFSSLSVSPCLCVLLSSPCRSLCLFPFFFLGQIVADVFRAPVYTQFLVNDAKPEEVRILFFFFFFV